MRTFFTPHLGVFRFNHSSNSKIKLNKMLSYTAVFGWILFERKYKSPDERGFFRYILYQLGEKCELKTTATRGASEASLYQLGKSANSRLLVLRVRARGDCVSLGKGAISVKAIFMQIRISPFFALDTNAPQFVDNTGAQRKQAEQDFINPWEAALFARPSSSFATKGWPGKACQSPRALEGQQRSMIR